MLKTLYGKLALALLGLFTLLTVVFVVIDRYSTDLYYQEVTQRLNAPIAMYVAAEAQLIVGGEVNQAELERLAHQAMVINPTVEVYLLDPEGQILGHAADADVVVRQRVAVEPIRRLLAGTERLPLLGDDPRSPSAGKIFTAFPVETEGKLEGYVYAILGGQKYEQLTQSVGNSYILQRSGAAITVAGLFVFFAGLLLFNLLTRRIRRLGRRLDGFAVTHLGSQTIGAGSTGDEIDRLDHQFEIMADRILQQMEQLKATDRTRRQQVTSVSHDLRTPLASMQGYIETLLIKDQSLTAEQRREYLEIARRHGVQLGKLVGELFELSKLETQVEPTLEAFSLAELLQDVGLEFQLLAREKGINLRVVTEPANSMVYADIALIQRVLENLLKNAIHYTPANGSVRITLVPNGDAIGVTVADTGSGIPENELPYIFDRCFRAKREDGREDAGAGLGLAIVKRILDLHGSKIVVESVVDSGTSFRFDLPLHRSQAA
jgi:signal transduction histidine kinase